MSPKILNILLILIPVVLYYGFFEPIYDGTVGYGWAPESTISSLQSQNASYASALNQVSNVETGIEKVYKLYQLITPDVIATTSLLLPDSIDPIKLKNEVMSIADKAGVAISTPGITLDPRTVGKPVQAYIVIFSFKARYPKLKEFMEDYQKNLRFYALDSLTIKRQVNVDAGDSKRTFDKEALDVTVQFRVRYLSN